MSRLRFLLRQHTYDADENLLVRPVLATGLLALVAVLLPLAEERFAALRGVGDHLRWAVPAEPAVVQLMLGTIAGSVMTVVSIIYSVLIVALTLASVQFSPRILATFMRDRVSQKVIGLFIGTFTYCLLVLRATRSTPDPFVPTLSAFLAIVLVLSCLGSLLFFVHHMARGIQANHIVDRIALETEHVIDSVLPLRSASTPPEAPAPAPADRTSAVRAPSSGYVQLVATDALAALAQQENATIHVVRGMGQFVPEGGILALVDGENLPEEARRACADAFDLGPIRTMQDDLELGLRLIVDIALKAVSPAVNDPSTAATCVDHLGRLLARIARRGDALRVIRGDRPDRALVVVPPVGFEPALDLAFHQIRQYGKGDMAVLLRIVRALADLASMTDDPAHRAAIARHAGLLSDAAATFGPHDRAEFERRQAQLLAALAGG